tara:strand:+ start:249 stop:659 length:411 start_codon:yes stop_codon:yes gene_type:complete
MDMVKIFRALVVVNFMMVISFLFMDWQSFINSNTDLTAAMEESYISVVDSWNFFVISVLLLALLASGPLLFFFIKLSRELLVSLLVIVMLIALVDTSNGSFILSSDLEGLMNELIALTHGAILAIAYLTPVKDKFN